MEYTGERFLPEECTGEIYIEHYQRYQFASRFARDKTILDAACGEGYGSRLLSETASMVVGMDIDPQTIEEAERKYHTKNLSFRTGDIAALPFEASSFDMVVSFETIEHVDADKQEAFLREIRRVLKPEGVLIMSTPNKAVYTDLVSASNHFHIREFYPEEFVGFLKNGFQWVTVFGQFPDLGYFIDREEEGEPVFHSGIPREKFRYLIAVCSAKALEEFPDTKDLTRFDDSMYYFLNSYVHHLEDTVQKTKREAEAFQEQQERSIRELKNDIASLEGTIAEQRQYIGHLERDIKEQAEYIPHLERDLGEQKQYIAHLERDLEEQKQYIRRLEKDRKTQAERIQKLEHRSKRHV